MGFSLVRAIGCLGIDLVWLVREDWKDRCHNITIEYPLIKVKSAAIISGS